MRIANLKLGRVATLAACGNCKKTEVNLYMVALDSKEGLRVGCVFCCEDCFDIVKGKETSIEFKPGHGKEAHD